MKQQKLKIIELFSGIGAQRKALSRINIPHEVVGVSEICKNAHKSYEAIFGQTENFGDITKIEKLPYADLWTYSFPCTDLSVAGKCRGLNNTRSGLLYEVERLLNISGENNELPKYLLLENVKNLVGKKFKGDFDKWLEFLNNLGYNNYWQVLNAKDYEIPQNRERVFVVSIRKDIDKNGYNFPNKIELKLRIKDIVENNVDKKYYLNEETQKRFFEKYMDKINKEYQSELIKVGNASICEKSQAGTVYHENGISPTLCAGTHGYAMGNILEKNLNNKIYQLPHGSNNGGIKAKDVVIPTITTANWQYNNLLLENIIIDDTQGFDGVRYYNGHTPTLRASRSGLKILEPIIAASRGRNPENTSDRTVGAPTEQMLEFNKNGTSNTLTTVQKDNYLVEPEFRIRKLTPLECWRLMGFDDEDFYKAKNSGLADTHLYKQAGNSIVVNVLEAIFENLLGEYKLND